MTMMLCNIEPLMSKPLTFYIKQTVIFKMLWERFTENKLHWFLTLSWRRSLPYRNQSNCVTLIQLYLGLSKHREHTAWKLSQSGVFLFRIFPYLVRMRENWDLKNLEFERFYPVRSNVYVIWSIVQLFVANIE